MIAPVHASQETGDGGTTWEYEVEHVNPSILRK
jgi:hypothetical protein